jgi:hypothetical protein
VVALGLPDEATVAPPDLVEVASGALLDPALAELGATRRLLAALGDGKSARSIE